MAVAAVSATHIPAVKANVVAARGTAASIAMQSAVEHK